VYGVDTTSINVDLIRMAEEDAGAEVKAETMAKAKANAGSS
jgi:hypothetical protein